MVDDLPVLSSNPDSALKAPEKGRGAVSNLPGRFERHTLTPFDDRWGSLDDDPPRLQTTVTAESARTIISRNQSPDIPFTQSINPYRGCEHGCIYCYARPSHAFLDLSPGIDFESRIVSKPEAGRLLRRELSQPGYDPSPIALGTNTDPYQPTERKLGITRDVLEVLAEFRHPFTIVTKSALVLRDLDLIAPAAEAGRAMVFLSVTTLDRSLARTMEPRAAAPQRRIETIAGLSESRVPTGVMAAPMVPALNDHELEAILGASADAGAESASYLVVRLPNEVRPLFVDWIGTHFPDRAGRILGRIRDLRSGRLNDPRFGSRGTGEGVFAKLLRRRFELACRKYHLNETSRGPLDRSAFRVPNRGLQGRLF